MTSINITDATCSFGLAQTYGSECSRSFASLDPAAYLRTQITYLTIGAVSLVVTSFLYWRAVNYDTPKLQQRSLVFSIYASLSFVFRSADPNSYRHIIPHPIVCFFSDSCTAALYSLSILSLSYWVSVIQRGAVHVQRPLNLKLFEKISITFVWLFYLLVDTSVLLTKGFFTSTIAYVQMLGSAGFLVLIGVSVFVYGVRIRTRLLQYERQKSLVQQSNAAFAVMDGPSSPTLQVGGSRSHANKIIKILAILETFVVTVVAAQIYTIVMYTGSTSAENNCANGFNCDDVHASVSFMSWFQLAGVWIVIWVFRKVEKRSNDAELA